MENYTLSLFMVAQRRRRWANISPALVQRPVFDRLYDTMRWREMTERQTHSTEDLQDGLRQMSGQGRHNNRHNIYNNRYEQASLRDHLYGMYGVSLLVSARSLKLSNDGPGP